MARGSREIRSLLVAAALHGAAIFSVSLWAGRHPQGLVPPRVAPLVTSAADEFDVDWAAPEAAAAPSSIAPQPPSTNSGQPAWHGRNPRTQGPKPKLEAAEPAPGEPLDNDSHSTDTPTASTSPERPVDLGLGSDGWQRWLLATQGAAPPSARRAARPLFRMPPPSNNGGLREGLEAHDRALGMGTSGPALRTLFDAAHGEHAPATGLARFQVTVLKSGAVEVSLRDATSELAGWRAVAEDAASRLRKTPPRVPGDRNGVRLLVEITAENRLPNGLKQRQLRGPHVELSGPKFRSTADAQKTLKALNPVAGEPSGSASGTMAITDLPGIYVAQTGSVCGYRVGLSALGPVLMGGCDLSNLGAKPQRMVQTRVVEETAF